jgi:hypothetical protein
MVQDIKPGNILLTSDGTPIFLTSVWRARQRRQPDRRAAHHDGHVARHARIHGAGAGRQSDVGSAADIYALAVTLCEM